MKKGRPRTKRRYKGGYRSKESFLSQDPEKRLASLEGRQRGLAKINAGKKRSKQQWTLERLQHIDIITFAEDVLGLSFTERPSQRALLKAMYGLPLSVVEKHLYKRFAGGTKQLEPHKEKTEAVLCIGARGGKSLLASIIALYESICRYKRWNKHLDKDEIGYTVLIATREKQCQQIVQANCARMLRNSKIAYVIEDTYKGELRLVNQMRIASFPCNSTSARGLPIFCLIFDELAHYRIEGVKADVTIFSSLRPRQAQFDKPKMLMISTPSAKQGLFYETFSQGFRITSRLTCQASTLQMNPVIKEDFIKAEKRRDLDNYFREFEAIFAEAVDSFFAGCEIELSQCFTLAGDLARQSRFAYVAAIDQSGLAGRDRFGFSIAHKDENNKVVVDVVRSWQTKDADEIIKNISRLCLLYCITKIYRDRYAAGWVEQALLKIPGILEAPARELLPVVYTNLKSLVLAGNLLLPDTKPLRLGLLQTQAYYSKANTLSIAHERSATTGHADISDAVATAVYAVSKTKRAVKAKILGNLLPTNRPSLTQRVAVMQRMIEK